jgi:hypothetical protein
VPPRCRLPTGLESQGPEGVGTTRMSKGITGAKSMPLYTVITQTGVLTGKAKGKLAPDFTAVHSEYSGVPKKGAHLVFHDYAQGNGSTAGELSATAALTLLIRHLTSGDGRIAAVLIMHHSQRSSQLIFEYPRGHPRSLVSRSWISAPRSYLKGQGQTAKHEYANRLRPSRTTTPMIPRQ